MALQSMPTSKLKAVEIHLNTNQMNPEHFYLSSLYVIIVSFQIFHNNLLYDWLISCFGHINTSNVFWVGICILAFKEGVQICWEVQIRCDTGSE